MNTKVNPVMPIKSGEMQIKELKGFSRSLKHNGVPTKPAVSLENGGKPFSEELKEIVFNDRVISEDIGPKLREPDVGLNPVKPRYEKQSEVKNSPAHTDQRVTDKGLQQNNAVNSDIASDSGSGNPDIGQSESEVLNLLGYNVNITDEGTENLADVNNQSVLLQLQGVFAPDANNSDGEQTDLNDVWGENGETEPVLGIDTENKTNTVKPSVVNSDVLTEGLKTEKTEDGNLPLQNGEKDKSADKKVEKNGEKVTDSIEKGKSVKAAALFKGTLEELIKQGEVVFGDIITFKVTDKGIFIGGEGDSTEDLSNLVDGDFLQKLFDVLSETLENVDQPTISEQFRQLLITAIQKAVSNMHDPVKKEEEYQQKLVEFLMKFVDAINGKDDEDKKVALENDDGKDKGNLLLQLIENLIESAKKNSDDDEYTAAIYVSAFEIGLLTPEQGFEESKETDADPTAAVEHVSEVKTDSYGNSRQIKEPVHKTIENAANVTEVNEERTVRNYEEIPEGSAVYSKEVPEQSVVYSEESTYEGTHTVSESVFAENNSDFVDAVSKQGVVNTADTGVNVRNTESVAVENVQSVSFDNVYEAVQPAEFDGKGSQSNADSGKKSAAASISSANRYGRRVQNTSDEVEELKRLFGIKNNRDDEKMKEKNDILESTEEDGEENKTAVDENQGAVKAVGEETDKEGFEKSIIESVTLEAVKADNTAVAKGYTPDENGAKQIVTQIISEMLNNLSDVSHSERTVTTLTMTLNPESLGKITMKISEEAGKISLLVTAHNKETAEILTQRMEAMQQAAKDSGTQLEKYQVVYGPEQDSRAGQQNYDGSSKNPYVRQDTEETQKDDSGSQFADFLKQAV